MWNEVFNFKELIYNEDVVPLWNEGLRIRVFSHAPHCRLTLGVHSVDAFKYDAVMGLVTVKFTGIAEWEDEWMADTDGSFYKHVMH